MYQVVLLVIDGETYVFLQLCTHFVDEYLILLIFDLIVSGTHCT